MICPACGRDLLQVVAAGISIDACKGGCGGLWFDNFELKKFDEPHEAEGESLLEIERDETIKVDPGQKRNCPKCNQAMMKHFSSVKKSVEVDECPACAGIWLDFGELRQVRGLFKGEEEKRQAAGEYFGEVFGEELSEFKAQSQERRERARKIANMFRFVCPSYYIPGKQRWGAF